MSKCDLDIVLEKSTRQFAPGEVIRGHVRVTPQGDVECRALTLTWGWRTHGKGNRTEAPSPVVRQLFHGRWTAGHVQSYPFELVVPRGPATYHGHFLNVDHYIHAEADIPWSGDPTADVEILVPGPRDGDYDFGPGFEASHEPGARRFTVSTRSKPIAGMAGMLLAFAGFTIFFFTDAWLALLLLPAAALGIGYELFKRTLAERQLGTPTIQMQPNPARPGDTVTLSIVFQPQTSVSVKGGRVGLTGLEQVVSGSGTNRTTHSHTVHSSDRALGVGSRRVSAGHPIAIQETIEVPETAAPTFVADDNRLTWTVHVSVLVDGWPDWEKELPLAVRPRAD